MRMFISSFLSSNLSSTAFANSLAKASISLSFTFFLPCLGHSIEPLHTLTARPERQADDFSPALLRALIQRLPLAQSSSLSSFNALEILYDKSLEFWTNHAEQGGMNYLYQNQDELNIKVKIVDFPYVKAKSLYNVRSKGSACGGNQMFRGKVYVRNYKDPNNMFI